MRSWAFWLCVKVGRVAACYELDGARVGARRVLGGAPCLSGGAHRAACERVVQISAEVLADRRVEDAVERVVPVGEAVCIKSL